MIELGFETVENAEQLDGLLRILPARDRLILELRFRGDQQQARIGDIVGISQIQVSRAIRRSIDRLHAAAGAAPRPPAERRLAA